MESYSAVIKQYYKISFLVIGFFMIFSIFYIIPEQDNYSVPEHTLRTRMPRQSLMPLTHIRPATESIETCHVTPYQPWDVDAKKYIPIPRDTRITCKEKPPLLERVNATHLVFNMKAVTKYFGVGNVYEVRNISEVVCFNCEIARVNYTKGKKAAYHDNTYRLSNDCRILDTKEELPFVANFLKCFYGEREIYRNIYSAFPRKISEDPKQQQETEKKKQEKEKLSALFISLDALSKNHFHRAFPMTKMIMKEKGFFHFNKFISSGFHTLPNMINTFSGETYIAEDCWRTGCDYNRSNSFIWKEFQKAGYVTAFFEDRAEDSAFNYRGGGFSEQPTEYYGRPKNLAVLEHLEITNNPYYHYMRCYGDRFSSEITIDDCKNFASRFKSDPYFGIFWTSYFTHDELEAGFYGDVFFAKLLMDLFTSEATLNNTMLFFIADHGMEFGRFRSTNMAWVESKMPIYTVWLPQWFRQKYKTATENLLSNVNRLVSSFDTYKTLRDILNNDFSGTELNNGLGISLFRPIPKVRTCNDAGIDAGSCVCSKPKNTNVNLSIVIKIVQNSIKHMERVLGGKVGVICDYIKLDKVLSAKLLRRESNYADYHVTFRTLPGPTIMEAIVRHFDQFVDRFEMLDVNRIDRYGNQSICVNDRLEKMYCYCKHLKL